MQIECNLFSFFFFSRLFSLSLESRDVWEDGGSTRPWEEVDVIEEFESEVLEM